MNCGATTWTAIALVTRPVVAWRWGVDRPVVKFQSYLAGSAFALLLAAHIAMELLDAYPVSQYLWHVNIVFAREARPLLQHIDTFAGGSSVPSYHQ